MGLFSKKKPGDAQSTADSSAPASSEKPDPRANPNLIRVFDEFGRELFITKEQWRTSVLPGTLKSNWNNPDQLYGIIVGALKDEFFVDIVDAAEHLSPHRSSPGAWRLHVRRRVDEEQSPRRG